MGDDATNFHNDYPRRPEHKRKYDDDDDHHERRHGFSSGDRPPRRTGFSGPPSEPRQHERKSGFSGPHPEHYDRKTGFSGPPLDPYERKTGFSGPLSERKSGFSGPNEFERKTGFSGPPGGEFERKTGFSGPPMEFERKSGFSGPPGGGLERRGGYFGGDYDRKSGFSGPYGGDPDRKSGFSDSRSGPPALNDIEIAKQKAAQIAARLVAQDSKRARTDETDEDDFSGKFDSDSIGYTQEDPNRGHMFQDHSQMHYHSQDRGPMYGGMQGHPQSKKMDIPNGRVGVVIGKGGETIKYLQHQSGAKIQITRDADHDPSLPNRQVEIMGTTEQINRAEQMIKDVIAEAEAGGPAAFTSGGSNGPPAFGESIQMKVPTNKVGLIIGRGGDTIRNLQSQSGARIQLMHTPTQDYGQERVLTLVGTKQQTDTASELIREIIEENRTRGAPGGYNQGFRPPGPPQFAPPRAPMQPGHGYQQGSFSGPPQSQPFGGYGPPSSAGPPQPYGGYGQQPSAGPPQQSQQSSPHPQQYPPQMQSYGGYGQQSSTGSAHEYSGQPPYGGFPQHTAAPGHPVPQQTAAQGYYNQPAVSPSESNPGGNQPHGAYSQQNPYGQGYGQHTQSPYSQQQSYGPASSTQQGYGPSYMQQSFGRQPATEQGVSAQPTHGAKQTSFQQGSYSQQDSVPAYGQGGPFQPGYPSQGASQQDASIHPVGSANAPTGSSQVGYGYDSQGLPSSSYIQQGPPAQQKGHYGAQPSNSSMYAGPNQSSAQLYSAQGPAQSNYSVQGSMPPSHQAGNSYDSRPNGDAGNVVSGVSASEE